MNYRDNFLKAARKIGRRLNKVFPNPTIVDKDTVLDEDHSVVGSFVQSTPEIEELINDAEAAKAVIENVDRAAKYLKRDSDHYAYPEERRKELVEKYREAKKRGQVSNKERWIKSKASVNVRTFLNWEKEFPE